MSKSNMSKSGHTSLKVVCILIFNIDNQILMPSIMTAAKYVEHNIVNVLDMSTNISL